MAATEKVKDVLWRISVLLQDVSPQFQRWSENEIVNWLNDGQMAIVKYLPAACSRIDAVKLKAGTRQSIESIAAADCKPGDGSTPSVAILGTQVLDVIRNMGSDGVSAGRPIRVVKRETLDVESPNWHSTTGSAVSSYTHDPRNARYFYVTPGVPASPAVWAEVSYTAQPTKIPNTGAPGSELYLVGGSSTTVIGVADEFVDDLVNYVVARANMKNAEQGDMNKASAFSAMFTGSLNSKVAAITGNNPNLKFLPFAPEPIGAAN